MGRPVVANNDPGRLARIREPRWGPDLAAAWQEQAQQKAAAAQAQRQAQRQAAAAAEHTDAALARALQEARAEKRAAERRLLEFRAAQQSPEKGREWDLTRPQHQRLLDDNPHERVARGEGGLGPAALVVFAGEDLQRGERLRKQEAQCAGWWAEQRQAAEQRRAEAAQQAAEQATRAKELDAWQCRAISEEGRGRAALKHQLLADNEALARERRTQGAAQRAAADRAAADEVAATLASPWLSEQAPADRVAPAEYKGMSAAQLREIQAAQLAAAEQRQADAAQRAQRAHEAALAQEAVAARLLQHQGEQAQEDRRRAQAHLQQLGAQMQEKLARDRQLAALYENQVRPEYFGQFETSHR